MAVSLRPKQLWAKGPSQVAEGKHNPAGHRIGGKAHGCGDATTVLAEGATCAKSVSPERTPAVILCRRSRVLTAGFAWLGIVGLAVLSVLKRPWPALDVMAGESRARRQESAGNSPGRSCVAAHSTTSDKNLLQYDIIV